MGTLAHCVCECGNTKNTYIYDIVNGKIRSCGCLLAESRIKNADRMRLGAGIAASNSYYYRYKQSAKDRDIEFLLDKEDFDKITSKNCFYCDSLPEKRTSGYLDQYIFANGIDRVDSNVGYNTSNTVPCCRFCNVLKMKHNVNDFLLQIKKIYENLDLSRDESEISYKLIHGEHHD